MTGFVIPEGFTQHPSHPQLTEAEKKEQPKKKEQNVQQIPGINAFAVNIIGEAAKYSMESLHNKIPPYMFHLHLPGPPIKV